MRKLPIEEVRKNQAIKAARTMVRLKHSLQADEELNDVLPDLEEHVDSINAVGTPWTLDLPTLSVKAIEPGGDGA